MHSSTDPSVSRKENQMKNTEIYFEVGDHGVQMCDAAILNDGTILAFGKLWESLDAVRGPGRIIATELLTERNPQAWRVATF